MDKIIKTCFSTKIKAAITLFSLLTSIFGVIGGLYSAASWADTRYAKTADVAQKFDWIQRSQLATQRQQYEDKVFELKLSKPMTSAIQALIDRYEARMQAIDVQLSAMVKSSSTTNNGR